MGVRSKKKDGYSWRCPNRAHEYSIRRNSFFERAQFPIPDVMEFLLSFAEKQSLYRASARAGMHYGTSAVHWANFIRDCCKMYIYEKMSNTMLSGTIEIDESLFGRKVKNNMGNPRGKQIWIFGLIDRDSQTLLLYPVDRRDRQTLIPLIEKHVAKGSRIYYDGWAAYNGLNALGYDHFTVLHKYAFTKEYTKEATGEVIHVDTNRMEGAWAHAKKHFRTINGTSIGNFEAHLSEIMWRSHEKGNNIYKAIFDLIRKYYTLDGPCNLSYPTPLFDTWDPDTRAAPTNTTVRRCSSDEEEEDVHLPDSQNMLVESDDGHITMPMSLPMGTCTPIHPAHSSPNLSDGVHLPVGIPKNVTVRRKKIRSSTQNVNCPPSFAPTIDESMQVSSSSKSSQLKKKSKRKPSCTVTRPPVVWSSDSDFQ